MAEETVVIVLSEQDGKPLGSVKIRKELMDAVRRQAKREKIAPGELIKKAIVNAEGNVRKSEE